MVKLFFIFIATVTATACGEQTYNGNTPAARKKSPTAPAAAEQPPPAVQSDNSINDAKTIGKAAPESLSPPVNPCEKERKILVVDLKSGWFAGDGGEFFKQVTSDTCGGLMKIHYVHFTSTLTESNIDVNLIATCVGAAFGGQCTSLKDIRSYDQFWLLSGDESDPDDLRISGDLFVSIMTRAKELRDANPKAGFYFGAGLGNIHHANAMAKILFPQLAGNAAELDSGLFSANPSASRGTFPSADYPNTIRNRAMAAGDGKTPGTFNSKEIPFSAFGIYGNPLSGIFDYYNDDNRDGLPVCFSDVISPAGAETAGAGFKVIATDACAKSVIATAKVGEHSILADGNTARYYGYGSKPEEYFHRVIYSLLR